MSSPDPNIPNQDNESKPQRPKPRKGGKSGVGTSMPAPGDVQSTFPGSQETRAMAVTLSAPSLRRSSGGTEQRGPEFRSISMAHESTLIRPSFEIQEAEKQASVHRPVGADQSWGVMPSVDHLQCHKWDLSQLVVQELPLYFPLDNIKFEFPSTDLAEVCERLSQKIRGSSIQARFDSNPLSAKLETCEGVELYVVFFQDRRKRKNSSGSSNAPVGSGLVYYMSIQRRKGDKALAAQYTYQLLDAAKGVGGGDEGDAEYENRRDSPLNPESLKEMENLIARLMAGANAGNDNEMAGNPFEGKSHEQISESAVLDVHSWLTSNRFDLRKHALEYLIQMTDLNKTLSSTAIAGALVVLQGRGPTAKLDEEAQTIQNLILLVLMTRELPNDRSIFDGMDLKADHDRDEEMKPYFPDYPDDDTTPPTLPHFYTEYMHQLFHMALQILVQSLEVVACFHESLTTNQGINVQDMAQDLFAKAADVARGKDLYTTLLGCIGRAESKLSNGYLACKALRLLARGFPGLKQRLKEDEHARTCIGNAFQVGTTCHTLLKVESEQLWLTVSSP